MLLHRCGAPFGETFVVQELAFRGGVADYGKALDSRDGKRIAGVHDAAEAVGKHTETLCGTHIRGVQNRRIPTEVDGELCHVLPGTGKASQRISLLS